MLKNRTIQLMNRKFLWHSLSVDETLKKLKSSMDGLTKREVEERRERFGLNELPKEKPVKWWTVLFGQLSGPMIVILAIAAFISAGLHEWVDTGVIVAAIVVNTAIGFFQELKASRALEHLQALVQPHAFVVRDGKEVFLTAKEIIPGDVLVLKTGDSITADARLIESIDLQVNEASLTGESVPISKSLEPNNRGTVLAERTCMVFAGTAIVGGRGRAVVAATATDTELGSIAQLVSDTKETKTPLQHELGRLARWIAGAVVFIVVALFFAGLFTGRDITEMFEISVALAVAAVPEGLIVSVTIILAIGMQRILRRKSLVRRLVGAETLGSVSVICTDKTGTLTEGEMQATKFSFLDKDVQLSEMVGKTLTAGPKKMVEISVLCNDASVAETDAEEIELRGSPTERALIDAALRVNTDTKKLIASHKRLAEIPFDSEYKFMVTLNEWKGKENRFLLKGAPDIIVDFCDQVEVAGKKKKLNSTQRALIDQKIKELTSGGIRLIACAYKPSKQSQPGIDKSKLGGFIFVGFICLQDPLRPDVKKNIMATKKAGVQTVVITGDHPRTARAIAEEAGLYSSEENVVTGAEIDLWSDQELEKRVGRISVYARVEPAHKIRIVRAWQARGHVVAMTGDGVNDAPALKAADIGLALGSGTEVAKQASDVVIMNNNLGTISAAIEQGRVIFDNIRKVTVYLMSDSFTEIILIGGSMMLGLPLPLLPAQILWINLVADSFPGVGLTLEPGERDTMSFPPRPKNEPVLNKEMISLIFVIGIVTDVLLFALYFWLLGSFDDLKLVQTMMFAAVGIDSLMYVFAVKSFRKPIFKINPFSNKWLILGILVGFGLMLLAILHPFFQEIFEVTSLGLSHWGLLLMIGLIKLIGIEVAKWWFILKKKRA